MSLKRKNKDTGPVPDPENVQPLPKQALLAHLKALRNVVLVSAIAVGVAFLALFLGFSDQLMGFLKAPMDSRGIQLVYLALSESLVMKMKVSLIAGIILASPVIFFQIWSFLRPALYPREGRLFLGLTLVTVFLFVLGSVFAYFIVFQMAISFFLVNSEAVAAPFISIERYVNFLASFVLPFGLMFELPIVMSLLTRSGLIPVSAFAKSRKYVIFGIFILAAILTPPDVISQVMLAIPLIVLFEVGILVSRITQKRAARRSALEEAGS